MIVFFSEEKKSPLFQILFIFRTFITQTIVIEFEIELIVKKNR
jgi:hypothetical protein